MQKDLKVNITPAIVGGNFDEIKKYLTVEVAKYEIEVFEHTVKDAKKLSTELNAVKTAITTVKKNELEILEAPVKDFKEKIATLIKIVDDGRGKIADQVKVFEDKTKLEIKGLLEKYLSNAYEDNNVSKEYQTVTIDDLVILGSRTATGNLASKAMGPIDARVSTCHQLETAVKMRLLQLKNECYEAGLKVPLSPEYIKNFLKEPEDIYSERLAHLIKIELDRQVKAEEQIIADNDKIIEAKVKIGVAESQIETANSQPQTTITPSPIPEVKAKDVKPLKEAPEGKKTLRINISFDIIVREHAEDPKVLKKMREILQNAGIPELNKIEIEGA